MLGKHKHYEKCNLLIDKSVDGVNPPHGTVPQATGLKINARQMMAKKLPNIKFNRTLTGSHASRVLFIYTYLSDGGFAYLIFNN